MPSAEGGVAMPARPANGSKSDGGDGARWSQNESSLKAAAPECEAAACCGTSCTRISPITTMLLCTFRRLIDHVQGAWHTPAACQAVILHSPCQLKLINCLLFQGSNFVGLTHIINGSFYAMCRSGYLCKRFGTQVKLCAPAQEHWGSLGRMPVSGATVPPPCQPPLPHRTRSPLPAAVTTPMVPERMTW